MAVDAPKVYAIHENPEWWPPFAAAFEAEGVPVEQWLLTGDGTLDVGSEPPQGVFWSRMSASSHTRGHTLAKEQTRGVLAWLEAAGRRVVNGRHVLELEMSKVEQYAALRAAGIEVPRTIAVVGRDGLRDAARRLVEAVGTPFITKHNQGGKGLGVRRFDDLASFDAYVEGEQFEPALDGITLVQEYVEPAEPFITRAEFVGGQFVYALRASTAQGFQLCPADACEIPSADATAEAFCPVDGGSSGGLFELRKDYRPPLTEAYERFLAANGVEIAGIEFIEAADGRIVTYDVNTNTNYNPDVEAQSEHSGPQEIARYLGGLLRAQR